MENQADKGVERPAAAGEDTAPQAAPYFPIDGGTSGSRNGRTAGRPREGRGVRLVRNPRPGVSLARDARGGLSGSSSSRLVQPAALWRRALQMRSRTRPPTRRQAKHLWSSRDAKVTVTRMGRDGALHATMMPPWALARRDRARGERRQGAGSVPARGVGRCSRPEPRARPRPRRGSPYCTWRNRVVEP